jgi:hypothetical protein
MTRRNDRAGFVLGEVTMVEEIASRVRASAVYHRSPVTAAESAIHRKLFKMQDFVSTLRISYWRVTDARPLVNLNTPAEWSTR